MFVSIDFNGLPKGVLREQPICTKILWNFEDEGKRNEFYDELRRDFEFDVISDFSFCVSRCGDVNHWASLEERWSAFVRAVNRVGYAVFGRKMMKYAVVPGWNTYLRDAYKNPRDAFRA